MSREVRRVPIDFDYPIGKVWIGYLRPKYLDGRPCENCDGGETWASRWLYRLCNRINLLAGDVRLADHGEPIHPYFAEDPAPPIQWRRDPVTGRPYSADAYDVMRPSTDITDLIAGIAGCAPAEVGDFHSPNTEYDIYRALIAASGIEDWGTCSRCEGRGEFEAYPGQFAEREAWEPTEPPEGDGWQLWSTVSDGSPASPVFPDAEALAEWLLTESAGLARCSSMDVARRFVQAGWAPSGYSSSATGAVLGPEWIGSPRGSE